MRRPSRDKRREGVIAKSRAFPPPGTASSTCIPTVANAGTPQRLSQESVRVRASFCEANPTRGTHDIGPRTGLGVLESARVSEVYFRRTRPAEGDPRFSRRNVADEFGRVPLPSLIGGARGGKCRAVAHLNRRLEIYLRPVVTVDARIYWDPGVPLVRYGDLYTGARNRFLFSFPGTSLGGNLRRALLVVSSFFAFPLPLGVSPRRRVPMGPNGWLNTSTSLFLSFFLLSHTRSPNKVY